ncbi:protein NLRC3 [Camelus ferus]|nr:protein NLRC3 [Camelus ferus]
MRKQEVQTGGEVGQGHGAGSPAEQVKALVDLLAGKGGQGSQAPQPPNRTPESPLKPHGNDLRIQRHREALLNRTGGGPELGSPSPRLTSLLLVEGLTDLQLREHDFTQVEATRGGWCSSRTITLDRLFLPLSRVSIPPRISITIGVAGVGKTTLVRNFIHLWARGQVGKDFSLVLPLTFRDLNTHEKLSADRLVRSVFPHAGETGLASAALTKVLLVLDGLDECKTPLDFSNTVACTDPRKEIQVDHLITNIIRGNLFPEVSVWVTSRPSAAGQIPGGLVDRMTEIRGFNKEEIKMCLEQMFPEDPVLSGWVLSQVQADRALYLMCTVPAFCRLAGLALGHLHRSRMALGGEVQEKGKASPRIEQLAQGGRKVVGTLGRLAFHGLVRKKYVFYEPDLKVFGVDLALLQTALCGCLLQREETLASSVTYYFTHLSLQEFVAAAYYYSASAAQRAMQVEDGRLDVFLRFLSGLLSPRVNALLAGSLLTQGEHQGYRAQHTELTRSVEEAMSDLLHCRSLRLDTNQFKDPVMELLGSVLSGKDCRIQRISLGENQISNKGAKALARSLLVNRSLTTLDLRSNSIGPQGAKALADALKINRTLSSLSLQSNMIRDDGARFMAEALAANRTLSVLHLQKNTIGPVGTRRMADALKQNRSLKELMFSSNSIGDGGAKALAEALKVNQGLESLDLQSNSISDSGVAALMGALCANQTLLSLKGGHQAGKPLELGSLAQPLQTSAPVPRVAPGLRENSISSEGAQDLARALCANSTLKSLDLTANLLHDQGAQAIAVAVRENRALTALQPCPAPPLCFPGPTHREDGGGRWEVGAHAVPRPVTCFLQGPLGIYLSLLQWNFIQASAAKALGQALQLNTSLTSLDLQENAIGDEGASAVASALKANTALTALYLQVASIGALGAQALGEALAVNRTLEILDLRGNAIGVAGAKALANALKVNSSLRRLKLQNHYYGYSFPMKNESCARFQAPGLDAKVALTLGGNV